MNAVGKTFKIASYAAIPLHLMFSQMAYADEVPLSLDNINCHHDGGMQTYVRDILSDMDSSILEQQDRDLMTGGRAVQDYSRQIVPLIYKMQRHAVNSAAELIEKDTTGLVYPIVRDEVLCAIKSKAGRIYQEDISQRMIYRDVLAKAMMQYSEDIVGDFTLLLSSLEYEHGRKQYGLFGVAIDIDYTSELMYTLSNAIPSPLQIGHGAQDVPSQTKQDLAAYLLERIENEDSKVAVEGTFTLLGKLLSTEHALLPRLNALAQSSHPQSSLALEALRNTIMDNKAMPEDSAKIVFETLFDVINDPDSSYRDRNIAEYGLSFIAKREGQLGERAQEALSASQAPSSAPAFRP